MNPTAIYSKSGKGVQESSGKTSLLKRADRAVLSAIDGRANLSEVAQKVGKAFDAGFESLIAQLDKDGFIREVSPGVAPAAPKAAPAKAPGAAKPPPGAKPAEPAEELDFTAIMPSAPKSAPPPPKPSVPDAAAKARAKEQESALHKARLEAEARAQAERERTRAEAEAKIRAETEAKLRAETEKKVREEAETRLRAEADAKAKAARDAAVRLAAEAKARAEADAKAKIEIERKAREEAERKAKEEADKARKEAEELRQRLEEERAKAEAERRAREAEDRRRREEDERRRKEEEERRAREEAERKAREEAERKAREEAERKAREEEARRRKEEERERQAKEQEERRTREEAERKKREEEDRRKREEEDRRKKEEAELADQRRREEEEVERAARRRREEEEERVRHSQEETLIAKAPAPAAPAAAPGAATGGFDDLLKDLDSFSQREEEERKAKEEADRKAKEEKARKSREEEERRAREEADREHREAEERRRREEEERRAREEEERAALEAQEREKREAEERKRKAKESVAAARQAAKPAARQDDDIGVTDEDLDMDDVKRDEAAISAESRKAARERELEAKHAAELATQPVAASKPRRKVKWGKPAAIGLAAALVAAVGLVHVMPVSTGDYEKAAAEALGRPVKIGSGRLSLITGVQANFADVTVGDARIASVRAYPELGSLFDAKKSFTRIELEGMTLPQSALGDALFGKAKGENFSVARVVLKQLKLDGPLALPALDAEVALGPDGAMRAATVRGPDSLVAKLAPKGSEIEFDVNAGGFAPPFAPEMKLSQFGMKGTATSKGMNIASWDGAALDGTISGTATVRWGGAWNVEGVITARGINAAVFAPALLSEGRGEGTGRFSMSGADAAKLADTSRLEGSFTVNKGALGSFDLSRAIQTGGRQASGRTQFAEMNGQGVYDKGAVALRNVTIGAGALNAGVSADITRAGALSGRIVADVKTATQTLRATLNLGGTLKEPQVKN